RPDRALEVACVRGRVAEMRLRVDRIDADIRHVRGEQSPVRLRSASDVQHHSTNVGKLDGQVAPDGGGLEIEEPAQRLGDALPPGAALTEERRAPVFGDATREVFSHGQATAGRWPTAHRPPT